MFAIGLLLVVGIFILLLFLSSRVFPVGRFRTSYVLAVVGILAVYPFAHLFTPTYGAFKELCNQTDRFQILKSRDVSYIYSETDIGTDCSRGPAFIAKYGYAGFDCKSKNGVIVYRYTKMVNWQESCGLECFQSTRYEIPEANYRPEYRYGFIEGKNPKVAYGYGVKVSDASRQNAKLVFTDRLVVQNEEVMAYSRDYTYYPYGNGWAQILGLASGTAPSQSCSRSSSAMDLRMVFRPVVAK
jgi:hypothetical protein